MPRKRIRRIAGFIFLAWTTAVSGQVSRKTDSEGTRSVRPSLFSRLYGCEAAGNIANSMGDVTEGLTWQEIESRYGFVDRMLPQDKKDARRPQRFGSDWVNHAHHRPPGMTEDGFERHRLCTSAILKKGGRITIEDLAKTWMDDIDPAEFGYLLGPQDRVIYDLLKSGLPPWEAGRYAAWPGFIGTSKMILPVGMVNACRPDNAARDALDLGRIKDCQGRPNNFALEVCAAIAAATAEALRPAATVQSVLETALEQLPAAARKEVERGIQAARKAKDWKDARPFFEKEYSGKPISNAVEVLSGALAIFLLADGQPKEAILHAVNFGRDTDCKAYVAGGLSGALRGVEAIPAEWIETVEKQVVNDPYTVSKRTARQAAEGLYKACLAEMQKQKTAVLEIESLVRE